MLYQISLSEGTGSSSPITRVYDAERITGGLSNPSKMPGHGYSLPATACKIGSVLAKIEGTTCSHCYALKGRYGFPTVQAALERRLTAINNPMWVEAMVFLIQNSKDKYFRWHDSGDIQSAEHLGKIVEVCQRLPKVKFWLPTREYAMVQKFVEINTIPVNLVIRLSAHKIDASPTYGFGLPTSTVHSKTGEIYGVECRAYTRENSCGKCRKCWDVNVANVSYHQH